MKKVRVFDQNHGLTALENFRFFGHIRYIFLLSKKDSFLSRTSPNIISGPIFNKNKQWRKFEFLPKIIGKPLCKISDFSDIQDTSFYCLEKIPFYLEHPQTPFLGLFSIKTNNKERSNFSPKSWLNPFGKFPIFRTYKIHIFIV